jgi:hypothetical protein
MNTLTYLGAILAASIFAAPICALCTSIGFSGVAALAGAAVVVLALVPGV